MEILFNDQAHHEMSTAKNPYGDGSAAKQIVKLVERYLIQ
jgi:UDP-N-acetylglucosamine 2-epimerase